MEIFLVSISCSSPMRVGGCSVSVCVVWSVCRPAASCLLSLMVVAEVYVRLDGWWCCGWL